MIHKLQTYCSVNDRESQLTFEFGLLSIVDIFFVNEPDILFLAHLHFVSTSFCLWYGIGTWILWESIPKFLCIPSAFHFFIS